MSGRRILVTGAGGFVGSHLVGAIVSRGDVAIGLGERAAPAAIRDSLDGDHVVDVRDVNGLKQAVSDARPDAVIHLAAQSGVGQSLERPLETLEANGSGTWNLLEAIRRVAPRVRVLFVGSADVYGPQPEGTRVKEDAPLNPVSPYGLSKTIGDITAQFYGSRFGLDVVRTRSFPHIGPGQSDRFVVPTVARQIAEAETGRREPVIHVGNLEVTRDFTPVAAVADAYLTLIDRGRSGAVYNVCRGVPTRLSDLAQHLVGRARTKVHLQPDPQRMRPSDIPYLVGDPTAITRDTGWRANFDLEQTVDQVLDEWRSRVASHSATGRSS